MAQPLSLVLDVSEISGDQDSPELSPYEESEVHDSFHQLIQEQSLWMAEEGLELQQVAGNLGASASGHQILPGAEGGLVYSTATLNILASMPSRTIGRSRGAIISQYYNRTVRMRRRNSRPPLGPVVCSARPSLRLYDLELDSAALQEDEKRRLLVKELQGLPAAQRDHMLRGMPLSLQEKRFLREKSRIPRGKQRSRQGCGGVFCCSQLRYTCALGCFTHTVMYYGYYSNAMLNVPCGSPQCSPRAGSLPYDMPVAYLFTVGAAFFITCLTLVYSMSHSFGESYRVGSTKGAHAITVFCSWDYKVTQKWASRLQRDNIRTQLKELLAEWRMRRASQSTCGRLRRVATLVLVWLLCLGAALGCAVAVLTFSEVTIQSPVAAGQEAGLLVLPVVVCLLNLVAPYLFRCLAILEQHDSPVLEVYVAICRNLVLKMAILGVLCYHWLGRRVATLQGQCWEDCVGQELYRFLVMDFVFALLDSLFGELVWR
ncbi:transmembrane channel-like protein 6 isoform X4 [Octodon degus]|uniref:Transmembrane channel-like protein n=1 Tax=Octodon degus TaxID=10160 RepID=A0A6P6EBN7_OCTDE|nr:transmembrane channel-like protein 6 isoform X4 [Octodon degus]